MIPEWLLGKLSQDLAATFDLAVKILPSRPVLDEAYDVERSQYKAVEFLTDLRKVAPRDVEKILGVAPVDLYNEQANFVFGEAELGGQAAVVSIYHLADPDESLYYARFLKESLHELGHTFGFTHDRNPECVMSFSASVSEVDRKGLDFCQPHYQLVADPQTLEPEDRQISSYLEGLSFPAAREEIIKYAINLRAPKVVLEEFFKLPALGKYNSADEVLETIEKIDRYNFPD